MRDSFDEYVDRLGNLTIANEYWNKTYGNLPFSEKKQADSQREAAYESSNLRVQRILADIDEFDRNALEYRGNEIIGFALTEWGLEHDTAEQDDGSYPIIVYEDGDEIKQFNDQEQNTVMVSLLNYFIDSQNLLSEIEIPYIPGHGDRVFINDQPAHADGREMEGSRELSFGHVVFTKLSSGEKQRYLNQIASILGLSLGFSGEWERTRRV